MYAVKVGYWSTDRRKQGEATTERETRDADETAEVVRRYRESAGPSEFLIALRAWLPSPTDSESQGPQPER